GGNRSPQRGRAADARERVLLGAEDGGADRPEVERGDRGDVRSPAIQIRRSGARGQADGPGARVNRSRARQWSRSAFALAALFASFPIAARLLLGEWAFEGATGIAGLWLAVGVYLYIRSRRLRTLPDPAQLLDEAIRLFSVGE